MTSATVLVAVRNERLRQRLSALLACAYRTSFTSPDTFSGLANADIVVVSCEGARQNAGAACGDTLPVVDRLRQLIPVVPIIVLTPNSSTREAVAAFHSGANDYVAESASDAELRASIERCLRQLSSDGPAADTRSRGGTVTSAILGASVSMARVRAEIDSVRTADSHVLITGETGTGKELVAQAIHDGSARRKRPFVRINCAAIPEALVESELFGHERGAFTGAESQRPGMLGDGAGGTVFFDEIGDMSASAQAKILRVIESREMRRLGGRGTIAVDIRVIAATNRDLEQLISDGAFRADLYYRLDVARIHVPPLRQHKEDIPLLAEHYITEFNDRFGCRVEGVTDDVLGLWLQYDWPGNVRELRNVVETGVLKARAGALTVSHLSEHFQQQMQRRGGIDERQRVLDALFRADWNKTRAAEQLRCSRMTLYRRLLKHGLTPQPPTGIGGTPLRSPAQLAPKRAATNRP